MAVYVAEKIPMIIMGDFNCDMLQDSMSQRLDEMMMDYGLVQMMIIATKLRKVEVRKTGSIIKS